MRDLEEIYVYSDESRHRNERFLLLGGVWVKKDNIEEINRRVADLRVGAGYKDDEGAIVPFKGEVKWVKCSSEKYLDLYRKLIDLIFELVVEGKVRICIMSVDCQDPKVKQYNNLSREGFYKLIYQLYLHNSKDPGLYSFFPDKITNPTHNVNLDKLRKALDRSLFRKFFPKLDLFSMPPSFVKRIEPVDSKSSELLQIIDILIGALGYYQNRYFERVNASRAKKDLMKYVIDKIVYSGFMSFDGSKYLTVRSDKFNVWIFKPKN